MRQARIKKLSDVTAEPIDWIWRGKVARGKLTLISGDPGLGKSLMTCDIASRVSTGSKFPDGPQLCHEPRDIIMLTAEDGLSDTVLPRIRAASGDPSRIHIIDAVSEGQRSSMFRLSSDLEALRNAIEKLSAGLVVIDPIASYLSGVDSHKDSDIRSVLAPLSELAEATNVAVVLVGHLNKNEASKGIYRFSGSVGLVAACRIAWQVVKSPKDNGRRLLMQAKNNICTEQNGLSYTVEPATTSDIETARINWDAEPVTQTLDELVSTEPTNEKAKKLLNCQQEIESYLKGHGPVKRSQLTDALCERYEVNLMTRAFTALNGKKTKQGVPGGGSGPWWWSLPGQDLPFKKQAPPAPE